MIRKILLVVTPLFVFLGVYLSDAPALRWLELKSLDWRFAWRGPIAATGDVVVVAIDDKSLARVGHWPWPRETVAQLLHRIQAARPTSIALDIIFAEAAAGDAALATAIRDSPATILGYYFYQTAAELAAAELAPTIIDQSFNAILPTALPDISGRQGDFPQMTAVVANIPSLTAVASAQGYFNAAPDRDGSIRRAYLMAGYRQKIFPSLGIEALSRHENGYDPILMADTTGRLTGINVGTRTIPTQADGSVLINYRGGAAAFHTLSASDVLAGKIAPAELAQKTVLVGATAIGIYDLRVTPIAANLPGVYTQANLIDMLYRGDLLQQNHWTHVWNLAMITLLPIVLGIVLLRGRLLSGVVITSIVILLYGGVVQLLFQRGMVVALVTPTLEWVTLMAGITVYRGWTEERQKRLIRRAFQSYLHPSIVEKLTQYPDALKLGGQRVDCSILFCDIKNFSTISETMEPEELTQLMNAFFDPICQIIMAEGGYVDKLIGDAVMAVFGVPIPATDHATHACRAALKMQACVQTLEPQLQQQFGIAEFKLRVGIHTGSVVVGNMGTRNRLNYTVMGDAVNLASRLEGANKDLGTATLISQATVDHAGDTIQASYVAEITVKGKAEHIKVYTLL